LRPRIGITIGDVAGVGPEIVVRALADADLCAACRPVVFGNPEVLRRAVALAKLDISIVETEGCEAVNHSLDAIACINPAGNDAALVSPAQIDSRAGHAAYEYLMAATRAALAGQIDAIVTAPLNKLALHQARHDYPGHTEILAEACGVREYAMMLYLPAGDVVSGRHGLGVAHVTLHTSIASVPGLITEDAVVKTIRLVDDFTRRIGCGAPRVGVCALNPHAGEGGLFGDEEQRIIEPAVRAARNAAIDAQGPFPADTLLKRAIEGEFDGVAAMYHDQGHIALKLIAFHRAVNVTLGLPIIRTSPTQGTAFDIAWRGKADPTGMKAAIQTAVRLAGG
jgi:4-hydroxythreonine-4-phosphate dehydrogenase